MLLFFYIFLFYIHILEDIVIPLNMGKEIAWMLLLKEEEEEEEATLYRKVLQCIKFVIIPTVWMKF